MISHTHTHPHTHLLNKTHLLNTLLPSFLTVKAYVTSAGRSCDFCFATSIFMAPLVVSVTTADSILLALADVMKPFDPSFSTSFLLSLSFPSCFLVTIRVFYAHSGLNVQSLRIQSLVFRLFAQFSAHSLRSRSFPLFPTMSGVSVHSLFSTSSFFVFHSDSCDFDANISPGGAHIFP